MLREICNKAMLLHHGRVRMVGPVDAVLAAYESGVALEDDDSPGPEPESVPESVPEPRALPPVGGDGAASLCGAWSVAAAADDLPMPLADAWTTAAGCYEFDPAGGVAIALTLRNAEGNAREERYSGRYRMLEDGNLEIAFDAFREKYMRRRSGALVRIDSNRPSWETGLALHRR